MTRGLGLSDFMRNLSAGATAGHQQLLSTVAQVAQGKRQERLTEEERAYQGGLRREDRENELSDEVRERAYQVEDRNYQTGFTVARDKWGRQNTLDDRKEGRGYQVEDRDRLATQNRRQHNDTARRAETGQNLTGATQGFRRVPAPAQTIIPGMEDVMPPQPDNWERDPNWKDPKAKAPKAFDKLKYGQDTRLRAAALRVGVDDPAKLEQLIAAATANGDGTLAAKYEQQRLKVQEMAARIGDAELDRLMRRIMQQDVDMGVDGADDIRQMMGGLPAQPGQPGPAGQPAQPGRPVQTPPAADMDTLRRKVENDEELSDAEMEAFEQLLAEDPEQMDLEAPEALEAKRTGGADKATSNFNLATPDQGLGMDQLLKTVGGLVGSGSAHAATGPTPGQAAFDDDEGMVIEGSSKAYVDEDQLVPVGKKRLAPDVAGSFQQMLQDPRLTDEDRSMLDIVSGYRSPAEQQGLRAKWEAAFGDLRWQDLTDDQRLQAKHLGIGGPVGRPAPADPDADFGTHTSGESIDLRRDLPPHIMQLLNEYGFEKNVEGDDVHWTKRRKRRQ